ncbi:MAG: hypothetical protein IT372_14385 [Polyangiaceae bacterium]|nr:hypothetical protein [Polyangiaceae bacterium]
MKKQTARDAMGLVTRAIDLLEESLVLVAQSSDPGESRAYRHGVGYALSEIHDRILDPILREHPDLLPDGIDYQPPAGPTLAQIADKA